MNEERFEAFLMAADDRLDSLLAAADADLLEHLKQAAPISHVWDKLLAESVPPRTVLRRRVVLHRAVVFAHRAGQSFSDLFHLQFSGLLMQVDMLAEQGEEELRQLIGRGVRDHIEFSGKVALEMLEKFRRDLRQWEPNREMTWRSFLAGRADDISAYLGRIERRARNDGLSVRGLDVSALDCHAGDIAAFEGVRWDEATIWPRHLVEEIRLGSVEIGPGVYQIVEGPTLDHVHA